MNKHHVLCLIIFVPTLANAAPTASVEVGPAVGGRHFSYQEGTGLALRDYSLGAAAGLSLQAQAFPVRARVEPGLSFGYFTTAGLVSDTDTGRSIGSIWTRLDVALRARVVLGSATVGAALGISREAFGFVERTATLPASRYFALRAGLDGRVALGPVALLLSAAALPVLSIGGIVAEQYASPKAFGLEGALGVAFPINDTLEVAARASHTRYAAKWTSALDPSHAASGATDGYSRLQVTLVFSH